ncbi:MAG: tRNA uridine-5-carboxymethylaminomethyl(34) synthesis enzyme MnmG [Oscillospiraceae bacterium]|jgi:tRNA uridine 5-carboxymethylaminomethyl modification enzyme|nr:tRNA uridine-5-carboxymethylaminomethyl(34) synthesis enzyme MnmG [Oscillospiraceae bacterium]
MRLYDVAVVGAGHAGIEAALAASRLGCSVICFATQLDAVGNMPCNPSVGGTAKGHLVREIDALGGEMGKAADACCIQYRMLNRGKGPAVHSLRAQADRIAYRAHMKRLLEREVTLKQAEIVDIAPSAPLWRGAMPPSPREVPSADGGGSYILTAAAGTQYTAKTVVIATGTFLNSRVLTGAHVSEAGPDGLLPAKALSEALLRLGLRLRRFKTGTPPRALGRTIDFSQMERQDGEDTVPFSFTTPRPVKNIVSCWMTWTNEAVHAILRENLDKSPMYSGVIEGVGARYCPSIEDKVVRFADKERHPVFCEPMGLDTDEYYLQGLSSSMPEDVQERVLHAVAGLERAVMTRPGYAIEYDCADPLCFTPTLMAKQLPGLFSAGQILGSSGYEEAAAQGLVAGINAARHVQGKGPFVLPRSSSYIGTLIDDLVTRGTEEPYRMMTSRSEYRLLLRQDNADARLTPLGYELGLLPKERYDTVMEKNKAVEDEIARLDKARLTAQLRRPEVTYASLAVSDPSRPDVSDEVAEQVEIQVKYEGYLRRQRALMEELSHMENRALPEDVDYAAIQGLRLEAREKLNRVRPQNLGQASRVSGVSPADLTALMIWLRGKG